jgi:hypothetical protein
MYIQIVNKKFDRTLEIDKNWSREQMEPEMSGFTNNGEAPWRP